MKFTDFVITIHKSLVGISHQDRMTLKKRGMESPKFFRSKTTVRRLAGARSPIIIHTYLYIRKNILCAP